MADSHVFVIMGNLKNVACDAWLLPTDQELRVRDHWLADDEGLAQAIHATDSRDFKEGLKLTQTLNDWPLARPLPVLTAVPLYGANSAGELESAVREFISVAARQSYARRTAREGFPRPRPLLGMPLFGTGGCGAGLFRGHVIQVLLQVAQTAAATKHVDVVLVLLDERDFALAQEWRKRAGDDWWADLDPGLRDQAHRLSTQARAGRLVPFMGSGVSISAGAPDWKTLIGRLAAKIHMSSDEQEALAKRNVLDQAGILQTLYEERSSREGLWFNQAVADEVQLHRYGLAPALLAGLPSKQAITLNYDDLFERASADADKSLSVIPEKRAESGDRWLLKLHGTVKDPATIVLTKDDYLGYKTNRDALSALVKATLMTHHLLFVGFGLADDHFHEIVHDVRRALPLDSKNDSGLATALTLFRDELDERAWKDKLTLVPMSEDGKDVGESARTLEIFLDMLLAYATDSHSYFLADELDTSGGSELLRTAKRLGAKRTRRNSWNATS